MSNYLSATWRLLLTGPADGATNMAVDEAILRAVAAKLTLPTLRLYSWDPPCLSLGRAQSTTDVDLRAVQTAGFDLVRRPTGGRAILHVDELTYSVAAPQMEPRVIGGIVESYRRLSRGLVRGLELLEVTGIEADERTENRGSQNGPVCFEVPSDYEITAGGRKLMGSAQMRAQSVVLQHGALPLFGDIARICPLLASRPDPARVRARAATVQDILGQPITWDEAAKALSDGLAKELNLTWAPGVLTSDERAWAEDLRVGKYTTSEWTERV